MLLDIGKKELETLERAMKEAGLKFSPVRSSGYYSEYEVVFTDDHAEEN